MLPYVENFILCKYMNFLLLKFYTNKPNKLFIGFYIVKYERLNP